MITRESPLEPEEIADSFGVRIRSYSPSALFLPSSKDTIPDVRQTEPTGVPEQKELTIGQVRCIGFDVFGRS